MLDDESLEELNLYLAESREHLATIESDLLAIEEGGAAIDEKLVNKVFRAAHSIKGGAGFFGLAKIQELGHKIENILDMIRSREMVPNPDIVNILLLSFDRLRELVNHPSESNKADIAEYTTSLTGLTRAHLPESQKDLLNRKVDLPTPSGGSMIQVSEFDLSRAESRAEYVYLVELDLIHDVHRRGKSPWEVLRDYGSAGTILECAFNFDAVGTLEDEISSRLPLEILFATVIDPSFIGLLFEGISKDRIRLIQEPNHKQAQLVAPPQNVPDDTPAAPIALPDETVPVPASKSQVERTPAASGDSSRNQSEETLRVNVGLLETLMTLAGELVLSRNQLQEAIRRGDARDLRASGQRISLVTSELQEAIMLTRMQPIGNVLSKFPRVVRDLARELGKEIQLDISGKEVELDKTLIEGLSEPLTHMVRNAVDHGIETSNSRKACGKDPVGKIWIRAYYAAGQVIVEIQDDGRGIDQDKVAASAVARGLVSEEQVRLMSTKEKMGLIFLPGLSTAEKVTGVSGRGVGMDVVKTNLDQLGGHVEIESKLEQGTTFQVTLPLTLAIIPSLLVSIGEERFAIPQVNIVELIHIPAVQVKERIEIVGDAEVLLLREKLVPLVRLADVLGIERYYEDPESGQQEADRRVRISDRRSPRPALLTEQDLPAGEDEEERRGEPYCVRRDGDRRYHAASDLEIVVMTAGVLEFGLIVEQLHDTIEIVVRPLGRHIKQCQVYGGATILGDGCVALILDVSGLATRARLISLAGSARAQELKQFQGMDTNGDQEALLLFRNAPDEPCAIPLSLVARVERIEQGQIERLGGKRILQYRGSVLPLVTLQDVAEVGEISPEAELVVIVLNTAGREFGLLAAMPVDAIETTIQVDADTLRQPAIAGSAILRGQTTLIVEVHELLEQTGWSGRVNDTRPAKFSGPSVLLAEDSDFFRQQVRRYLEGEGYTVLAAEDGQAAWELLEQNAGAVQLIVTDIEMPRLNGLDLTRRIKAHPTYRQLPVIALTSLADEKDFREGEAAGVDAYEIKLDKENLLEKARQFLAQDEPGSCERNGEMTCSRSQR